MAGSKDGPILVEIDDVPIAAAAGVAGPFVSGKNDELHVVLKRAHLLIELPPILVGHLKVVALMRAEIQSRHVARKGEIFCFSAGSYGRIALRVEIAPIFPEFRLGRVEGDRIARALPVAGACHDYAACGFASAYGA